MKKITTIVLLLILSFAYCFETIAYFSKIAGNDQIVWADDLSCDENDTESKKSDNKDEKKEFKEYFSSFRFHPIITLSQLSLFKDSIDSYNTNDYSIVVYSPPEQTVLA